MSEKKFVGCPDGNGVEIAQILAELDVLRESNKRLEGLIMKALGADE